MFEKWIDISTKEVVGILITAFGAYAAVLLYTRITGLRSFSKMSAPDFAMTIATGSILGATISQPSPTLLAGGLALLTLFVIQWAIAFARRKSSHVSRCIDNQPVLLMHGSEILHDNLKKSNLTVNDLMGKLREANTRRLSDVKAVIFETTGDVSVIHACDDEGIDPTLLSNVLGADRFRTDNN
ncbi:DUF421 domain-containing protein [Rhodopirellula sp. JC740]|uniref:DUF421 domain-containing protein n=1 Tax=Rhodopirellula halodulae TaxID=2894198 RepID=A0ABS8NEQ9_9BACT|nr:YetF domain-containing protein [Rhodopirellula sp. JC740]MCC9642044.1 DUF421 domain-containing protein [Rhodopirellula sp. JC740]